MKSLMIRTALLACIAALIPACGTYTASYEVVEVTENGVPGVLKIIARGGTGTNDWGGSGGGFTVTGVTSSSDLKILRTGVVNVGASLPAHMPNLGDYPRIIDADTTITYSDYANGNELWASFPTTTTTRPVSG